MELILFILSFINIALAVALIAIVLSLKEDLYDFMPLIRNKEND